MYVRPMTAVDRTCFLRGFCFLHSFGGVSARASSRFAVVVVVVIGLGFISFVFNSFFHSLKGGCEL